MPSLRILFFAWLLASAQFSLHAQLVADGASTAINGTKTNITGDLVVGTNGSFTTLIITNAGGVTNSGNGVIGQSFGANTNRVIVTDLNSAWTIGGNLNFGVLGSYSQLIITNGGKVENNYGNMAFNGGVGDQAIVTGANSLWTNRGNVNIGNVGALNQLTILNGGTVTCQDGLVVGNTGISNRLLVAAGGRARSRFGRLGNNGLSTGNEAVVTDAGSQWILTDELDVGMSSSFNRLLVTNSGSVVSMGGFVGGYSLNHSGGGSSNLVLLADAGSKWTNNASFGVGDHGSFNQLIVSNGAVLIHTAAAGDLSIGNQPNGSNNVVVVDGANSLFSNRGLSAKVAVGLAGSYNQLFIQNGGKVQTDTGVLGENASSSNNTALVNGSGSTWLNSGHLYVGQSGPTNTLLIGLSGTVIASGVTIGVNPTSYSNSLTIGGGSLIVTNGGNGVLEVRRGTLTINDGTLLTDQFVMTNSSEGVLRFNGQIFVLGLTPTLSTSNSLVRNGFPLVVGNGFSVASYRLLGRGLHRFNDGMIINGGANLQGSGTIDGQLTVASGGSIDFSPAGGLFQSLILSNTPSLTGTIYMRLRVSGGLTNDLISTPDIAMAYGGALSVGRMGATAPTNGNQFKLFSAASYAGAFSSISLPAVAAGSMWTNRLLIDGTIAVVPFASPNINGLTQTGTNLVFNVAGGSPGGSYTLLSSTNVALPLSSWTTNSTGNFDWLGNVTLANAINPATPQRYFTVRVP